MAERERAAGTRRRVALAALALALVAGCTDRRDEATPGAEAAAERQCVTNPATETIAYRTIPGWDPNLTSLDIHAPSAACDAPVVIWVHGGGYEIGDKSQEMRYKVPLFNDEGWLVVSVNYRLTHPDKPPSAVYPDHYEDVAAAVAWVRDHIAERGGDPDRIALLGHSAGADIVSNLLTNPTYLTKAGTAVGDLACAGPLDSEGFDKLAAGAADIDGLKQEWVSALSNAPDYLKSTSANWLIATPNDIPPTIGVVRGTKRRRSIEEAFLAKLAASGVATTRIDAAKLNHHQVNANIGAPNDQTMTKPLMAFLTDCFDAPKR